LSDRCFDHDIWRDIIAVLPHTPTELLVRTVKDVLADTGPKGTLRHIRKNQQAAALGFYAAFLDGLGKKLFPEIRATVAGFMADGDWQAVAAMISSVHQQAETMAHTIVDLYREGTRDHNPVWVNETLNRLYIEPLTA
jgi:secreted protein with Ig-like and vWFA domain